MKKFRRSAGTLRATCRFRSTTDKQATEASQELKQVMEGQVLVQTGSQNDLNNAAKVLEKS